MTRPFEPVSRITFARFVRSLCRKKRKTRSDKSKKHKKPEANLHEDIVKDLEKKGIPHYGPPNGAAQMAGNYAVGRVMKKRGASNGIPDIMIYRRGVNGETGLAIELKIGRNPLSEPQDEWFLKLQAEGWKCAAGTRNARPACVV